MDPKWIVTMVGTQLVGLTQLRVGSGGASATLHLCGTQFKGSVSNVSCLLVFYFIFISGVLRLANMLAICFCVDCQDAQGCGKADRTALIAGSFASKTTIILFGLACNYLWLIVLNYHLLPFRGSSSR